MQTTLWGQTAPTNGSSNINFTNVYCNEITLNWSSGNGSNRIVLIREGSAVDFNPAANQFYLANDSFPSALNVATNTRVVYNNIGTSLRVVGLEPDTDYYFAIFEYNTSAGTVYAYNTTDVARADTRTNIIEAGFTVNESYQCFAENEFSYTNTTTKSFTQNVNYNWTFADGSTSTDENPEIEYSTSGYKKTVLVVNSPGCSSRAERQDTVAPQPRADFELHPDTPFNTQVQCFINPSGRNNRFVFRNNSLIGTLPNAVNVTLPDWTFGDGRQSSSFNVAFSYPEAGDYLVKHVIQSTFNGGRTFCFDSAELNVSVNPIPLKEGDLWLQDSALCLNDNNFRLENRSPSTGVSTWTMGDGTILNGDEVSHSYTTPGTYSVELEMTDNAGCYAKLESELQVFPQPDNFFTPLDSIYCLNSDSVILTPNLSGGVFIGDGITPGGRAFNPVNVGLNSIKYIYNIGNCFDTTEQITEVFPLPIFSLGADTLICQGDNFSISIDPSIGTVSWSTGSTDNTININSAGTFSATVSNEYCSDTRTRVVTMLNPPFFDLGEDQTLCGGEEYRINVTAPNATFVWNDGSTEMPRSIQFPGIYELTATNACGSFSDEIELEFIQFGCDISLPTAFSPNDDGLNDIFKPNGNVLLDEMRIFNRWGQLIFWGYGYDTFWDGKQNGKFVPTGVYAYVITFKVSRNGIWRDEVKAGTVHVVY